jgi:hypothetical protein
MIAGAVAARGSAGRIAATLTTVVLMVAIAPLALVLVAVSALPGMGGSTSPVADIPPEYQRLYEAAAQQYGLDWAILAAIGKIETDHGRMQAAGVTSGVNFAGCCAGPMQFSIVPRPSTWDMFGVDGNHDGQRDVYDPADAIPAAARYLTASGAPQNYHAAILAYNHSETYYQQVMAQAAEYRSAARTVPAPSGGGWLAAIPGGQQCDRRIVPDVLTLIRIYHIAVTACYAPAGHAADGEHPLGLATDIVPGPGGSWDDVDRLAVDAGWTRPCGASGVRPACPLKPWLRFVGYDGYPGHGRGNHLHLSWAHGPGRPASTVTVFSR